jgi:hypothetical protein
VNEPVLIALLVFMVVQQGLHMYQTNRLVNKLMSRNYHEFQVAEKSGKIFPNQSKLKYEEDLPEDLRPLEEFRS